MAHSWRFFIITAQSWIFWKIASDNENDMIEDTENCIEHI